MTYTTMIPSKYHNITGEYLQGTECGHKHKSVETAEKCSLKRNPSRAPGTIRVEVVGIKT